MRSHVQHMLARVHSGGEMPTETDVVTPPFAVGYQLQQLRESQPRQWRKQGRIEFHELATRQPLGQLPPFLSFSSVSPILLHPPMSCAPQCRRSHIETVLRRKSLQTRHVEVKNVDVVQHEQLCTAAVPGDLS